MAPAAVHKYKLQPGVTAVDLSPLARILHVGHQGGDVFLWALVPLGAAGAMSVARRWFLTVGTGEIRHAGEFGHHIGTVQFPERAAYGGGLVFHVFETESR